MRTPTPTPTPTPTRTTVRVVDGNPHHVRVAWSAQDQVLFFFSEKTFSEFCTPQGGGYVRLLGPRGPGEQVCHGLASRGPTLYAGPGELPELIRRQLRVCRRIARGG